MSNDYDLFRNPTALLVLRVWMERGSALPLRAYIRQTSDVSRGFEAASTETDVEAAVGAVRTWLEGLMDAERTAGAADVPPNGHGLADDSAEQGDSGDGDSTNGADPGAR